MFCATIFLSKFFNGLFFDFRLRRNVGARLFFTFSIWPASVYFSFFCKLYLTTKPIYNCLMLFIFFLCTTLTKFVVHLQSLTSEWTSYCILILASSLINMKLFCTHYIIGSTDWKNLYPYQRIYYVIVIETIINIASPSIFVPLKGHGEASNASEFKTPKIDHYFLRVC